MVKKSKTQVEVIVYKIANDKVLFLLLKRNKSKGGFWQPITGGAHENENLIEAARRELQEETGIKKYLQFIPDVYYFEFVGDEGRKLNEYVFGVEVSVETEIQISLEHTESRWCEYEEALGLLKYKNNKEALKGLLIKIRA